MDFASILFDKFFETVKFEDKSNSVHLVTYIELAPRKTKLQGHIAHFLEFSGT